MARRHAVREVLQSPLLFSRRQVDPVLHEPFELLLIDVSGTLAAGISDIAGGGARRVNPFRRT
jgi:hypothetical protein